MRARVANAYAQAFVSALDDTEKTLAARDELARFAEALDVSPRLRQMAANPGIPIDAKEKVVGELCDRLEIGRDARSLLELLLRNFRLVHLSAVIEALDELLNRRRGIVRADVRSAAPLDDEQRGRLEGVLRERLDKKIDLRLSVDPDLLAGFVALIGSDRYDASLRGQLERLEGSLAEGGRI